MSTQFTNVVLYVIVIVIITRNNFAHKSHDTELLNTEMDT